MLLIDETKGVNV